MTGNKNKLHRKRCRLCEMFGAMMPFIGVGLVILLAVL
tara:strand:- start:351 stop:464 length:114 start_codon:yes stop_codon:yes gene_type:complete